MFVGCFGDDEHPRPVGEEARRQHAERVVYVVHWNSVPHGAQELVGENEIQDAEHNLHDADDHEKHLELHDNTFRYSRAADVKGAGEAAQERTELIATYRMDSHERETTIKYYMRR